MIIKNFKIGATGNFPRGATDDTDKGELRMALTVDHQQGIVRLLFGEPIAWLGLPANEARALATLLNERADELERGRT